MTTLIYDSEYRRDLKARMIVTILGITIIAIAITGVL